MGKYMGRRNPKSGADVALIDTGVRTRAKTLALQKSGSAQAGSYLQLRSRRLEKPPISAKKKKRVRSLKRGKGRNAPGSETNSELGKVGENGAEEASIGDNLIDFSETKRSTRESTPCNLIRDPKIIKTPGSSTKPGCSADAQKLVHSPMLRPIPTAHDMDAFFASAEAKQQQEFIEKYNFDPVNEVPLPGRYEWVKLSPKA